MKKGQAALEFLTTYAWAFIVILVTVGALYYFGVFNFSRFLPQECIFPSQFPCVDFAFTGNEVRFRLANDVGEEISVTDFNITNDAAVPLSCAEPAAFVWQDDEEVDFVFSSCTDGGFISGERVEAKISLTFFAINTPSQPEHTIKGKINAIVN